eukprot:308943-Prorocentrum_minimum.AAC.3
MSEKLFGLVSVSVSVARTRVLGVVGIRRLCEYYRQCGTLILSSLPRGSAWASSPTPPRGLKGLFLR